MTGAILAAIALFLMRLRQPSLRRCCSPLRCGCSMRALNIAMEPFRAFVGDMLDRPTSTPTGYAVQTAFIGAGAVVGSIFPWLLERLRWH